MAPQFTVVKKMTCGALADHSVRKEKWVSAGCREGDEYSILVRKCRDFKDT